MFLAHGYYKHLTRCCFAIALLILFEATATAIGPSLDPPDVVPPAPTPEAIPEPEPLLPQTDETLPPENGNQQDSPVTGLDVAVEGEEQFSTDPEQTATQNVDVGYDSGFYIKSLNDEDESTVPFSLKLNTRFQARHTFYNSEISGQETNDLEFERLRITLSGYALTDNLNYFIQLDGDSDQSETADFLDYFVNYDLGQELFGFHAKALAIRAGKWKMPFNRARRESGFAMQFSDRSIASVFFDINRSIGVSVLGKSDIFANEVNWHFALHNGFRTGGYRPTRQGELETNFGTSGRIFMNLLSDWGKEEESDFEIHECPAIRIGAGFAATRIDREGTREFNNIRVVDSGTTLASLLPGTVDRYYVNLYSVDANLKYRGLSILSEYYFRTVNRFDGASIPGLFDHGFMVQSGLFVIPKKLELIGRWSRIVGDSGTLGLQRQSADEVAGGLVWYIRGQSLKVTFDATHLNGAPIRDLALNILPGDRGMLYRTQLQVVF